MRIISKNENPEIWEVSPEKSRSRKLRVNRSNIATYNILQVLKTCYCFEKSQSRKQHENNLPRYGKHEVAPQVTDNLTTSCFRYLERSCLSVQSSVTCNFSQQRHVLDIPVKLCLGTLSWHISRFRDRDSTGCRSIWKIPFSRLYVCVRRFFLSFFSVSPHPRLCFMCASANVFMWYYPFRVPRWCTH